MCLRCLFNSLSLSYRRQPSFACVQGASVAAAVAPSTGTDGGKEGRTQITSTKMPGGLSRRGEERPFQLISAPSSRRQRARWDHLTLKTALPGCGLRTRYISLRRTSVSENVTVKCTLGDRVYVRWDIFSVESPMKQERCISIQLGWFVFDADIYTHPKTAGICFERVFF